MDVKLMNNGVCFLGKGENFNKTKKRPFHENEIKKMGVMDSG